MINLEAFSPFERCVTQLLNTAGGKVHVQGDRRPV